MTRAENPFASPLAPLTGAPIDESPLAEAERTRKKYLKHEASIQSIGLLYYLGGGVMGIASVVMVIAALTGRMGPVELLIGLFYIGLTALSIWLGYGLRRLDRKVKIPTTILAALGLIGFPIGTLINGYILYLLLSQKGTIVFSDDYRVVREMTPHIKYRTSAVAWAVLFIFIAIVVAAIALPAIMGR